MRLSLSAVHVQGREGRAHFLRNQAEALVVSPCVFLPDHIHSLDYFNGAGRQPALYRAARHLNQVSLEAAVARSRAALHSQPSDTFWRIAPRDDHRNGPLVVDDTKPSRHLLE